MERIWLASYERNVPADIDPDSYASLVELFEESCAKYANRYAFSNFGVRITYAELDEASAKVAAYLQHVLQLPRGTRVAIMMPNVLQYPVCLFGILRAGMVVVNVNPLYTASELQYQLQDSGSKAIFILANYAHVLAQVVRTTPIQRAVVTEIGDLFPWPKRLLINSVVKYLKKMVPPWQLPACDSWSQMCARTKHHSHMSVDLGGQDLAFLQYTGGTTGVSKGAMLTHRNMIANCLQARCWLTNHTLETGMRIITALPLYHIFSLTANCLVFVEIGGENILITNPRDIPAFIKTLRSNVFHAITGVNTLFNALLQHPKFRLVDFSYLKITLGGGMAVQRRVAEAWQHLTGNPLLEAYGLTEAAPAVCINPLGSPGYNGSIGLPVPSTEIKVVDEAGEELYLDEVGELCVRGPQVMQGYWQKEDETRKVLQDGWLKTGDIARVDACGFVYLVDRKKDVIIVSGFNVYPNEVEDVLVRHPEVIEAAVIGVMDEEKGEQVKAFVVTHAPISKDALIEHCAVYLTRYKMPKLIEFRDELPKTNVGKILRRASRDGG